MRNTKVVYKLPDDKGSLSRITNPTILLTVLGTKLPRFIDQQKSFCSQLKMKQ